jgi:hypothetical protein
MTGHTFFEIDPGFTEGRSAVSCIARDPDLLCSAEMQSARAW